MRFSERSPAGGRAALLRGECLRPQLHALEVARQLHALEVARQLHAGGHRRLTSCLATAAEALVMERSGPQPKRCIHQLRLVSIDSELCAPCVPTWTRASVVKGRGATQCKQRVGGE